MPAAKGSCPEPQQDSSRIEQVILAQHPFGSRIKELDFQKDIFVYYLERSREDIRRATFSWDNLRILLERPSSSHVGKSPVTKLQSNHPEDLSPPTGTSTAIMLLTEQDQIDSPTGSAQPPHESSGASIGDHPPIIFEPPSMGVAIRSRLRDTE